MKFYTSLCALFLLSGCAAPLLIIGSTATVGTLATREKGVTGTMGDTQISAVISSKLLKKNSTMFTQVDVNVQGGEVLLTGFVKESEWQVEAERLAWTVSGVTAVNNHIEVSENKISTYASDCMITTKARNALLFEREVKSLNYSIKTANGVIYVLGIAQNQEEHHLVTKLLSKISSVQKIVTYVRIKGKAA